MVAALVALSYGAAMSNEPDDNAVTMPVAMWLEIVALLATAGEEELAARIGYAMDGRRRDENAPFVLSIEEQLLIGGILQGRLDEQS